MCSHCDKAEWFFGPEPLARLSAHHAPFLSLVTLGRNPFLPGGLGGCRAPAVGCWDLCIPLAFGESQGSVHPVADSLLPERDEGSGGKGGQLWSLPPVLPSLRGWGDMSPAEPLGLEPARISPGHLGRAGRDPRLWWGIPSPYCCCLGLSLQPVCHQQDVGLKFPPADVSFEVHLRRACLGILSGVSCAPSCNGSGSAPPTTGHPALQWDGIFGW